MHAPLTFNTARAGLCVALSVIGLLCISNSAEASFLGLPESADWSDMAFSSGVSGSYNSGTMAFVASAASSNSLEIGGQFGPGGVGLHYGTGGTLGGPFSATLKVNGVVIQPDGTVTNGGTLVITHEGSGNGTSPVTNSMSADYANTIHAGPLVADTNGGTNTNSDGDILLQGTVLEVLLDATGDNTLDICFEITGGALQYDNPELGTNFAPANLGILRIAGSAMPSDFSTGFDFTSSTTIDVFGIPEPSSMMLGLLGAILAMVGGSRRSSLDRRTG